MSSPKWGLIAADGAAEMLLFRSVSARDNQRKGSYGVPSEKRRSTSFDETHGEFAGLCAVAPAGGEMLPGSIKKKSNFWHSRVWRFGMGKKGAMEAQHTNETLSVISEKGESTAPKWKKFLHKFRYGAKDARKTTLCLSNFDLQVASRDLHGLIRGEGKSKAQINQAEKQQRLYSVHPEPVAVVRRSATTAPIWERRSVACPQTLDLSDIRVTGLKHLPRPHQ
eukprot:c17342_g1_i1 orf=169-837(+)